MCGQHHISERQFFSNIFTQLSDNTIILFDSLLSNDVTDVEGERINDILDIKLRNLKIDVAGAKLKNVETEELCEIDADINKINSATKPGYLHGLNDTPRLIRKHSS
jgi:hypothetical protein